MVADDCAICTLLPEVTSWRLNTTLNISVGLMTSISSESLFPGDVTSGVVLGWLLLILIFI